MPMTNQPVCGVRPHETARIAANATLLGSITLGEDASIWPGAVLRGDHFPITIGKRSNVQDNCVVHVALDGPTTIGDDVTVGHGAIVHGCTIDDRCIIGMGAVIMNHAHIGEDCLIGAGAVVSENTVIPPRSVVVGVPGKVRRQLTEDEVAFNRESAQEYVEASGSLCEAGAFHYGNAIPDDLPMIRLAPDAR